MSERRMVGKVGFAASVLGVVVLLALTPAFACTANGAILKVTPGKADPGTPVTVIGEQFAATGPEAGPATIRWNGPSGVPVGTVDVGEDGTFQVQVVVPADAAAGFYQINATQWLPGEEAKKPSVTVEVLGPPAPAQAPPAAAPVVPEPAPAAPVAAPTGDPQAAPAATATAALARSPAARVRPPAAATPVAPANPVAPAEAAAAPVETAAPAPALVADVPPPVVAPGTVTADLWSGFGTVRSPGWVASHDAARTPAGSDDAGRLWMVPVIAGLALVVAGAVGLVRRPRALAVEAGAPTTTDD